MYSRILVPLDGSTKAEKVLPHVLNLARTNNAEIILLLVPMDAYADESAYAKRFLVPKERQQTLRKARRYLHKVQSELIRLGARVSIEISEGQAAPRIIAYARQSNVDLIAMFSNVRSSWYRIARGSVLEDVMRGAGKPVLLISPTPAT